MSSGSRRAAATVLSEAEDEPDVQLSLSKWVVRIYYFVSIINFFT
jgi:hypothetical protein